MNYTKETPPQIKKLKLLYSIENGYSVGQYRIIITISQNNLQYLNHQKKVFKSERPLKNINTNDKDYF